MIQFYVFFAFIRTQLTTSVFFFCSVCQYSSVQLSANSREHIIIAADHEEDSVFSEANYYPDQKGFCDIIIIFGRTFLLVFI